MRGIVAPTLRALAFLTRVPPAARAFTGDHPLGADVHAFPLAGVFAALPAAATLLSGEALDLSPLTASVLAIAATVWITGALHEDGLGDVADGLGGHHERARALAIMKDSRIGSYGALALILSIAARIALLAELTDASAASAALAYLGVAAGSRGAMAWLWSSLPSADPGGLADRVGQPNRRTGLLALSLGAGFLLIGGWAAFGIFAALLAIAASGLALLRFRAFLRRRLGGQTGDALGATQQITEISALLGLAVATG